MKISLSDIAIGALVGTILVAGGAVGVAGYYAMNPDRLAAQAEPNPIVASTEIAEPIPVPDTPAEAIASEAPAEQTLPSESFWNSGASIEEASAETPAIGTVDTAQPSPLSEMDIETGISNLMDDTFSDYTYDIDSSGNITVNYFFDTDAHSPTYIDNGQTGNTVAWSVTKASTALAAAGLYNSLHDAGGQNRNVTVNLLDVQNPENTLLQYVNGSGVYDSVTIDTPQSNQSASIGTGAEPQDVQPDIDSSQGLYLVSISPDAYAYHTASNPCFAANRIKEEDRRYYNSPEEAEAAGYRPCGICFR